MSAFRVGLTGGLASGKTTTANCFAAYGVPTIDADSIAHEITAPNGTALPALYECLGAWAFNHDGTFNRQIVRQRAFADSDIRYALEAVLHPQIRAIMKTRLNTAAGPYAIGVVPLLVENPEWLDFFQHILVVHCDIETQCHRAALRDGGNDAEAIMATQANAEKRLAAAHTVLNNNGDIAALRLAIGGLHEKFTVLSQANAAK